MSVKVSVEKIPHITSFYAHSIWGKYQFSAEFQSGINFISGLNGSGKTTLMRILFAQLSYDYGDNSSFDSTFAAQSDFSNGLRLRNLRISNLAKSTQAQVFDQLTQLNERQVKGKDNTNVWFDKNYIEKVLMKNRMGLGINITSDDKHGHYIAIAELN